MKLILASVFTLLAFNGCTPKTIYIKSKCPQLQTWEVQGLDNIEYEVYDENGTN